MRNADELLEQAEELKTADDMNFEMDNETVLPGLFPMKLNLSNLRPKEKESILKKISECEKICALSITE